MKLKGLLLDFVSRVSEVLASLGQLGLVAQPLVSLALTLTNQGDAQPLASLTLTRTLTLTLTLTLTR